jgi:hypothetical protein
LKGIDELKPRAGSHLGYSAWREDATKPARAAETLVREYVEIRSTSPSRSDNTAIACARISTSRA